ncbi:SinR family protein [Echinicola sp. CAU 1574]|uniref:SinR family protein n=1 Tax=Echinicola arenosa TaxID=2774144 RepID=A0ABR9AQ07_9BACT|nr:SinR family protein [Echinicola arenosa]
MKRAYIISYDLNSPGKNYESVLTALKSVGSWARLGGSAYIVISTMTAAQIRDKIMNVMDNNDQLFVGVVKAPAAWFGLGDEVSNWLKNNLD